MRFAVVLARALDVVATAVDRHVADRVLAPFARRDDVVLLELVRGVAAGSVSCGERAASLITRPDGAPHRGFLAAALAGAEVAAKVETRLWSSNERTSC